MKWLRVKKLGVAGAGVIVLVVAGVAYYQVRYSAIAFGDIPTWGLLAGAIVTAVYAARAFGKQSEELAEQRKLTAEQIGVLELQRRELEASTGQREREAVERREAQAAMVTTWFGSRRLETTLFSDPSAPVVTPTGTAWGAWIRNASHLPVFQVRVSFHYVQEQDSDWTAVDRGGPPEWIRVIPPGADRFVEIPDAVRKMIDQCDDRVYVTSIAFTDAADRRWARDPRGRLSRTYAAPPLPGNGGAGG